MAALATAGFGLVAALAWNDAIKALFAKIFPKGDSQGLWAMFLYAAFITVIVVLVTMKIGNVVNKIKEGNEKKES